MSDYNKIKAQLEKLANDNSWYMYSNNYNSSYRFGEINKQPVKKRPNSISNKQIQEFYNKHGGRHITPNNEKFITETLLNNLSEFGYRNVTRKQMESHLNDSGTIVRLRMEKLLADQFELVFEFRNDVLLNYVSLNYVNGTAHYPLVFTISSNVLELVDINLDLIIKYTSVLGKNNINEVEIGETVSLTQASFLKEGKPLKYCDLTDLITNKEKINNILSILKEERLKYVWNNYIRTFYDITENHKTLEMILKETKGDNVLNVVENPELAGHFIQILEKGKIYLNPTIAMSLDITIGDYVGFSKEDDSCYIFKATESDGLLVDENYLVDAPNIVSLLKELYESTIYVENVETIQSLFNEKEVSSIQTILVDNNKDGEGNDVTPMILMVEVNNIIDPELEEGGYLFYSLGQYSTKKNQSAYDVEQPEQYFGKQKEYIKDELHI